MKASPIIIQRLTKTYLVFAVFVTFFAGSHTVSAQNSGADSSGNSGQTYAYLPCGGAFPSPTDIREWTLRLGGAAGYGRFRDMGTAPVSFGGPALQTVVGVWHDRLRWKFHLDMTTTLGYYEDALKPKFNFSTFDISNSVRLKVYRRIFAHILSQEWVGVGFSNFLDITVNQNFENAAVGISDFLGPEIYFKGVQPIGFSWWSIYCEIGLMPVAAVLRPGYAYIDNYTATQPVLDAVFSDYQWNAKFMASISTEIGFRYWLENNNKLEFAYRWEFHSSGDSGAWRYDHATHMLQCNYMFNLKRNTIYEKNQN